MIRLSIILTFIFYLSFIASGWTQFTLQGMVIDSANMIGIEAVSVYHNESKNLTGTDGNGQFALSQLSTGVHTIIIVGLNFETVTKEYTITKDTSIVIFLNENKVDLNAVEIRAKRQELFALKRMQDFQGTSIFAGKKTEVVVLDMVQGNVASNNSRQVYAQIPGLNIYEGSDGGLQLAIGGRGLDPNRTSNFNTRQNGYDISADVLGYPENYYTPPTEALKEIQILRGAASLQYGTQFGGLINFKLKEIPSYKSIEIESNQTIGSYGFFNSFNRVGVRKNKLSINAFYNYKRGNGYRTNSEFHANNMFASIQYDFNKNTNIKLEYTYYSYLAKQAGGLTDQQFIENPRQSTRDRNWFNVDWNLFNAVYTYKPTQDTEFSVRTFGLRANRKSIGYRGNPIALNENPITALDEQQQNGSYISPRDLIVGNFRNLGAEMKYLQSYNLRSRKSIGLVGVKLFQSNNESFQGPGSRGVSPDFNFTSAQFPDYANQSSFVFPNTNIALFAENILYINKKLSITPGIRWEYILTQAEGNYNQVIFDIAGNPIANNTINEDRSLPRSFVLAGMGMNYTMNDQAQVYANISQNYRSVTFSDIRTVSPTFIVDPDISDERGFTFDIGIRGKKKKILSYDVGLYAIYYNDRIGILLDDRANRVRKNIGTAGIIGLESLIDINLKELFLQQKRSVQWNIFSNFSWTESEYLASEENNVAGNKVEFIPRFNWKTGMRFGYKNVLTSLQYSYISSQFTDVQNSSPAQIGDARAGIIGEIPSYNIVDFSISYTLHSFSLKSGINNVLDRAYYTRRATGYPGPGIIPSEGRSFYFTVSYNL